MKSSLNFNASLTAFVVGFILTMTSYSLSIAMTFFFLTASKATKYKATFKRKCDPDWHKTSYRKSTQVLCNGGVPAILAIIYILSLYLSKQNQSSSPSTYDKILDNKCIMSSSFSKTFESTTLMHLTISILTSICSSCGDTLASELAPITHLGSPILITTGYTVPKGTNGGVTIIGLIYSLLGGLFVGVAYIISSLLLECNESISGSNISYFTLNLILVISSFSGLLGSVIDSILGAIFQYSGYDTEKKCIAKQSHAMPKIVAIVDNFPIFDNNTVNLLSSCLITIIMPYFFKALMP
ncbi:unnamed protein product [Gordionus sp. m RMFG-2023]|uniref:transmembrane protein 19-like isoform X2 n=1 Tax=Gordionus sp. m RMFG-2023 TaxID=3053472 RepID=UPI0030E58CC1